MKQIAVPEELFSVRAEQISIREQCFSVPEERFAVPEWLFCLREQLFAVPEDLFALSLEEDGLVPAATFLLRPSPRVRGEGAEGG